MKIKPIKDLVHNINEWEELVAQTKDLTNKVIQDINFIRHEINWEEYNLCNTSFLGCKFRQNHEIGRAHV